MLEVLAKPEWVAIIITLVIALCSGCVWLYSKLIKPKFKIVCRYGKIDKYSNRSDALKVLIKDPRHTQNHIKEINAQKRAILFNLKNLSGEEQKFIECGYYTEDNQRKKIKSIKLAIPTNQTEDFSLALDSLGERSPKKFYFKTFEGDFFDGQIKF